MFKLKSPLIINIYQSIKNGILFKIRNFYSQKLNNKFFILITTLEFKIYKNNTKIDIENNKLDKFTETIYETNNKFNWFISNHLRSRAINAYIRQGVLFSGKLIAKNYGIEKMVFNESDIIIDCGANFGALWIFLDSLNLPLTYIGIEPGILEYQGLSKSIKYQKNSRIYSHLINKALSSKNGKTNFFYSEEGDSSIIEYKGYSNEYKVEAIKLESLLKEIGYLNKTLKLLKLEAEGAEPEVIKGALNLLKNIEYIAADLGPERGLKQESTLKEVVNILLENNFEIVDFKYPRICLLFRNKKFN